MYVARSVGKRVTVGLYCLLLAGWQERIVDRQAEMCDARHECWAGLGTVDGVNGHTSANVSGLVSSPQ